MPFSSKESDGVHVIQITGKFLGSKEGEAFKQEIDRIKEAGGRKAVIDLSKADFMDSSGMGAVIGAHASMAKVDGDIKLAAMDARIKNLFLITRLLGNVFENYDTVEEAKSAF